MLQSARRVRIAALSKNRSRRRRNVHSWQWWGPPDALSFADRTMARRACFSTHLSGTTSSSSGSSSGTCSTPYSTVCMNQAPMSSAAAAAFDYNIDSGSSSSGYHHHHRDEDTERFVAYSMLQFLPEAQRELELELGQDDSTEEDRFGLLELDEEFPLEEPTNVAHTEAEATGNSTDQRGQTKPSVMELLASFDPAAPPKKENYPDTDPTLFLEAMQLWLECEAQQESVAKYQAVLDQARGRGDYRSLSVVQRQIVQWFPALHETLQAMQKEYLSPKKTRPALVSEQKFGPFLCSLPPAKLAVILAHEAVVATVAVKKLRGTTSVHAAPSMLAVALKVGQAVEDEVNVHRLLHKRFKEAQLERQGTTPPFRTAESDFFQETSATSSSPSSEVGVPPPSDVGGFVPRPAVTVDDDDGGGGKKDNITHSWTYAPSHLKDYLTELSENKKKRARSSLAIKRARRILDSDDDGWSSKEQVHLGVALLSVLFETATIRDNGKTVKAFKRETVWMKKGKLRSNVVMHDSLYKLIKLDNIASLSATTTRHKPMVVPPAPWTSDTDGGYRMLKCDLMRYHGSNTQRECLRQADGSVIYDGLNALGRVPWKINQRILVNAKRCWTDNIELGDIPRQEDYEVPPEPVKAEFVSPLPEKGTPEYDERIAEFKIYRDALAKHKRLKQKNADLVSLRCSAKLKLDQAEKFQDYENIYFPYNLDFRGRAYPVPPHLSNVGSDMCRGLLKFAEKKPLGERGLFWLKVHLANFAGKDKMTFEERAAFVDTHMDQIRESTVDPFAGEKWWMTLEDPFQGLSTCYEIIAAIDSGDPASYMCDLPVHMDGSCNGLQHYAALGRDKVGGKAVNLCATDEPQDVYVGVMHEVIRRVDDEAKRDLGFDTSDVDSLSTLQKKEIIAHRGAQLVNGLIDRGVVKRTVMTSVYGVTFIGARNQIQEKIQEKLEEAGYDIDENKFEMFSASGYLAQVTMEVIGDLFTGAKDTMDWLRQCARIISQHGYPVAWISPIGLPAIQPYRQTKTATVLTVLQSLTLASDSDDLPIHKQRQVSAFPPNYIHSLDSSHMLLTALEMDRRGLTFSAVHDSFWTHPCDVDEMNIALRDVFVDLYNQPLLEELKETWEMRYPGIEFPELPKRGELDLEEVKKAPYFFQ